MANINRVVLVGNLTRDPELRHAQGGTAVCKLRLAVNTRRKDETGQWTDKPNYFDVTVWGNQAESCSQYLSKGRPVGDRRPPRLARVGRDQTGPEAPGGRDRSPRASSSSAVAASGGGGGDGPQFVPAGAGGQGADFAASAADDDIPF